jgi:hypothetical protein
MMKFKAPEHISSITLSTGPHAVVDGVVEVSDDTNQGDLAGLGANGFTRLPDAEPAAVQVALPATPASPSATEE